MSTAHGGICKPGSVMEHELNPTLRVAMNLGNDRSYGRIGRLWETMCPEAMDFCIRISDIEEQDNVPSVAVY